eukprot:Gb_09972 [translate_table: standard]
MQFPRSKKPVHSPVSKPPSGQTWSLLAFPSSLIPCLGACSATSVVDFAVEGDVPSKLAAPTAFLVIDQVARQLMVVTRKKDGCKVKEAIARRSKAVVCRKVSMAVVHSLNDSQNQSNFNHHLGGPRFHTCTTWVQFSYGLDADPGYILYSYGWQLITAVYDITGDSSAVFLVWATRNKCR